MILGLQRGTVSLVPHQPGWSRAFAEEKQLLSSLLGESALAIEHVGSTAVPELQAKPIIDIAISVHSFASLESWPLLLQEPGYSYFGDRQGRDDHFFAKGPEALRSFYLHVVLVGSTNWENYLRFRDVLRSNPSLRREYERLKQAMAEAHKTDRRAYTAAKNSLIQSVLSGTEDAQSRLGQILPI